MTETKNHETFKMVFVQKNTDRKVVLTVEAPLGWTYKQAYEAVKANNLTEIKVM